jgi:hypothetical protein
MVHIFHRPQVVKHSLGLFHVEAVDGNARVDDDIIARTDFRGATYAHAPTQPRELDQSELQLAGRVQPFDHESGDSQAHISSFLADVSRRKGDGELANGQAAVAWWDPTMAVHASPGSFQGLPRTG